MKKKFPELSNPTMKSGTANKVDWPVNGMKVAAAAEDGASVTVSGTEFEAGLGEFEKVAGLIAVGDVAGYGAAVLVAFVVVAQSLKALQVSPTAGLHMRTLTTKITSKVHKVGTFNETHLALTGNTVIVVFIAIRRCVLCPIAFYRSNNLGVYSCRRNSRCMCI